MMFFAEYNPVGCGKEEEREAFSTQPSAFSQRSEPQRTQSAQRIENYFAAFVAFFASFAANGLADG
jgi:hypothetical protein